MFEERALKLTDLGIELACIEDKSFEAVKGDSVMGILESIKEFEEMLIKTEDLSKELEEDPHGLNLSADMLTVVIRMFLTALDEYPKEVNVLLLFAAAVKAHLSATALMKASVALHMEGDPEQSKEHIKEALELRKEVERLSTIAFDEIERSERAK